MRFLSRPIFLPLLILIAMSVVPVSFSGLSHFQLSTSDALISQQEPHADCGGSMVGGLIDNCTIDKVRTACVKDTSVCTGSEETTLKLFGMQNVLALLPGAQTVSSIIDAAVCFANSFSFGKCLFIPAMGWLGSWFLTVGGFALYISASIFNVFVQYLVVEFGSTIQTLGLIDGIHRAWKLLRDISNIVIIGMFTFIAISIIIGNDTFGGKKLVAKVLVVAVLINFSLLFAKIVIDASNFVADQVYKSMTVVGESPTESGSKISDKFLVLLGITDLWNTADITQAYGAGLQASGERGEQLPLLATAGNTALAGIGAFLYGLVAGILLLSAAGILFYGSYLIVVRAILLVFLMLVSALAFASYLIPKLSGGSYGWSTWWSSLINASIFGPLLMILLYMSLLILSGAGAVKEGALNAPIADPGQASQNWQAIVMYIFTIGMLYVSFRVANSFSQKIAGFNMAGAATLTPLALGASLAGFAGRKIVGKRAALYGETVGKKLDRARRDLSRFDERRQRAFPRAYKAALQKVRDLEKAKNTADWLAKSKFKSEKLTDMFKKAGVSSLITGGKAESFKERATRISEDAAKRTRELIKMSEDHMKEVRDEARNAAYRDHADKENRLRDERNRLKEDYDNKKRDREAAIQAHEDAKRMREDIAREISDLRQSAGAAPDGNTTAIADAIRRRDMKDAEIAAARDTALILSTQTQEAQDALRRKERELADHDSGFDRNLNRAETEALEKVSTNLEKAAQDLAAGIAFSRGVNIFNFRRTPDNDYISGLARGLVKKQQTASAKRENTLRELIEGVETSLARGRPS